ncbi:MAG TPA: hypothetical protein VM120_08075 [Bryobacteraceae bacterium]|nr:hypothetical protein [Bryobacteraceae bacterium]
MAYQLFCDPIVGFPNNGDFKRVLDVYRLEPVCEGFPNCYFKYVVKRFRFLPGAPIQVEQASTEQLTILPAVLLNTVVSKDGYFDVRMAGLVHASLWLLGFWLAAPVVGMLHGWRRYAMAAVLVGVYCDVTYVWYSNSFYADTSAVICFFLALVLLSRLLTGIGNARSNAAGLMVAMFFAALAKPQHSLLVLPLLGFLAIYRRRYWPFHQGTLLAGSAAILGAIALLFATVPVSHKLVTFYSVVFGGILPVAPDRAQALRELELPEQYEKYAGTHAYSKNTGMNELAFLSDFTSRASHSKLLRYYAAHPRIAASMVGRGLNDASVVRYPFYGTLPKSPLHPERVLSRAFAAWSSFKMWLFHRNGWHLLAWFIGSMGALAGGVLYRWRARRDVLLAASALCAAAIAALLLGTLLDVVDTLRHLYMYVFLADTMVVAACAAWVGGFRDQRMNLSPS